MTTTTPHPRLESGDRLSREEFHRRYEQLPDIKKAELINGVVYVSSPMRWDTHDSQHMLINFWLMTSIEDKPEIRAGDNNTVFLPGDNEVQPDALLFRDSGEDGHVRVGTDGYLYGAPELIVDIAASSARSDLHEKREAYRRAGVEAYIVWRTLEGRVDWFRLDGNEYVELRPNRRGIIESAAFPGLALDVAAPLADDRRAVRTALRRPRRQKG